MKKLGLFDFKILSPDDKATILFDQGIFLMNRVEKERILILYSLYDFYVEVSYIKKNNSIDRIRTFKNIGPLKPYLDLVQLDLGFLKY